MFIANRSSSVLLTCKATFYIFTRDSCHQCWTTNAIDTYPFIHLYSCHIHKIEIWIFNSCDLLYSLYCVLVAGMRNCMHLVLARRTNPVHNVKPWCTIRFRHVGLFTTDDWEKGWRLVLTGFGSDNTHIVIYQRIYTAIAIMVRKHRFFIQLWEFHRK